MCWRRENDFVEEVGKKRDKKAFILFFCQLSGMKFPVMKFPPGYNETVKCNSAYFFMAHSYNERSVLKPSSLLIPFCFG